MAGWADCTQKRAFAASRLQACPIPDLQGAYDYDEEQDEEQEDYESDDTYGDMGLDTTVASSAVGTNQVHP